MKEDLIRNWDEFIKERKVFFWEFVIKELDLVFWLGKFFSRKWGFEEEWELIRKKEIKNILIIWNGLEKGLWWEGIWRI